MAGNVCAHDLFGVVMQLGTGGDDEQINFWQYSKSGEQLTGLPHQDACSIADQKIRIE